MRAMVPRPTILCVLGLLAASGCEGKSATAAREPAPTAAAPVTENPAQALREDGPRVRFGELVVEGARDGGALTEVIAANAGRIQSCYAATLQQQPEVAGELGIRFFVTSDGTVPDAILSVAKITDRPLQRCLMETFKGLRFPAAQDADGTRVTLPIFFGEADG